LAVPNWRTAWASCAAAPLTVALKVVDTGELASRQLWASPQPQGYLNSNVLAVRIGNGDDTVVLRFVPFIPGRRPTDEAATPGLGTSDCAAMVTGNEHSPNRAILLFEVAGLADDAAADASITIGGRALPGWDRQPASRTTPGTPF
jgi:hypothetical protein